MLGTSNSLVWGIWYVPNYTYLLYNLNPQNDQKHTNNSQNVINSSKCVLYVIQVQKIEKKVKTDKFHNNCRFQSLELHKMAKLVPKGFKWVKSQLKSLGNQNYSQIIPGWKFTQTGNFYPSSYKIGKNGPWVFKTWKFTNNTLVLCMIDNLEQFDKLLGIYIFSPWSYTKCQN